MIVNAILPAVGISILLKSVVTKNSDLIYFFFGFALTASMGLTLLAATAVGSVFALIDYKMSMNKIELIQAGAGSDGLDDDDDEDI